MQKVLLILSLAIVLLFSCRKIEINRSSYVGTYELSGTVLDELTGKPIAHADVKVIERERGWMTAWGGKLVGYQRANEKGEFNISFPANESEFTYELVATEHNQYFEDNAPPLVNFTQSGKGLQDITLMPKGYLKFHIKGNKGGAKLNINGAGTYYLNSDTSEVMFKTPKIEAKVSYFVYNINNELLYQKSDKVLIPLPPDTAFYLIEF